MPEKPIPVSAKNMRQLKREVTVTYPYLKLDLISKTFVRGSTETEVLTDITRIAAICRERVLRSAMSPGYPSGGAP